MTKLQYSGRGRGRGAAWRGRVGQSHHPAAVARHQWVRPKDDENMKTAEKSEEETPDSDTSLHRPILKGPPVVASGSKVWRRPKEQSDKCDSEKDTDEVPPPSKNYKETISKTPPAHRAPVLKGPKNTALRSKTWKRTKVVEKDESKEDDGSSKEGTKKPALDELVLKSDSVEETQKEVNAMDDIAVEMKQKEIAVEEQDVSGNQREPSAQDLEQDFLFLPKEGDDQYSEQVEAASNLQKIAPNKLILSDGAKQTRSMATSSSSAGKQAVPAAKPLLVPGRGRRRPRPGASLPHAKRIKVSHTEKGEGGESEGENNDGGKVVEKLTDFAYRETFGAAPRGRGRGRGGRGKGRGGRGRGRGGRGRGSMGLVRVQPDESKTPICPTFLRGLPCTNERCFKRHDVPQEFATPVCSFFQHQGMCFKEDCPFRHIKVNPRATVCPSFSLLGFCEDSECTMMHTRPRKKNSAATKKD